MPKQIQPSEVFTDPQFHLRVMRAPSHGITDQHRHGFEELVIILDGHGRHQVGTEAYEIATGDVFVLMGNMTHGYPQTQKLSLINVLYDPSQLRLPRADLGAMPGYHALFRVEPALRQHQHYKNRLKLSIDELARLANMVAELDSELHARAAGYRFMATMHLMEIVGFLSRCYSRIPARGIRPVTQISDLLSYMEQHYTQPLNITDLARVAHMSQSSLFRSFRQVMGRAPLDYLIHLRVGKAAQLLQRSGMRISEISDAVGFADSNYFTRQFRAIIGISPREYRRQRP